ncbi:DUF4276 family protein [Bordetella genomosp. 12]|uniref:DUF4276 domain-containing protein n=1 Tax=Bordetella genomosp. 12 TaxID=463035 RepID=A0A261VU82_9BORD|nr:DUF4276 family protein [Bordetella genomosp. 12]OZI77664.1 hypothetical protein CAL22_03805 [Bordetella genomosp. 12]
MSYFEVLVEGGSDVPTLREILTRKFNLEEDTHFRIHPHKGRGKLPGNVLAQPDPKHQALLEQLPAKLRGFGRYLGDDSCVLVVLDADDTPRDELLASLQAMLEQLPTRPRRVLFRLAIEETESWFIADETAILAAFPKAKVQRLRNIEPDAIVGAWETLADALGVNKHLVTGADKYAWAEAIAPHLDLDNPRSPSLRELVDGVRHEVALDAV